MKLALAISIAVLTIIGNPHYSKASPITCDQRGCSDWNSTSKGEAQSTPIHRMKMVREGGERFLPHPQGCPRVAFCACGAAVEVFGKPIRSLWPASAWFKFPRSHAAPGRIAVRRHHVFVLVRQEAGNQWLVKDYNSGGHRSREHVRSIAGWVIVDPHGGRMARL